MKRNLIWSGVVVLSVVITVVACGGDRAVMRVVGDAMVEAGREDAAAQPMTACRQWQVAVVAAFDWDTACETGVMNRLKPSDNCRTPAGWEAFASPATNAMAIRRCVDPAP